MSDLNRQQQRIVRNAQRAGLRMSVREGHPPTQEELLRLRVQVAPPWARIFAALGGAGAGVGSYFCFSAGAIGWGVALAIVAILLLCFSAFGVRRTFSTILDGLDAAHSAEILGEVIEGVFSAVGSLFD